MNATSSFRRLTPDDRPVLDAFLDGHRATSVYLRSNLFHTGIRDGPKPYCGLYVGAFAGDALTDVAAHYWNGMIILQAPARPAELALAAARESARAVNGLLGPWPQVEAAEKVLEPGRKRLGEVAPDILYRVFLDDLAVPEPLSSGRVVCRRARDGDLNTLVAWRREFELHTIGTPEHSINDAATRGKLKGMLRTGRLWVLEEAGRLVSMTGLTVLPDMAKVGNVFTPVEARRRGYGRAAVAGSLLDVRVAGATEAVLFTQSKNRPAQRAYESLGFKRIGDYGMVMLAPLPHAEPTR